MLILDRGPEIARWVGTRTGVSSFDPCQAIGVERDGKLIAGIVYSNYRCGNVEATIAAEDPRWCTRSNLRVLFTYPFKGLDCRRMTCIVAVSNVRSRKLCQGLGFEIEGLCREVFESGEDGLIMGLLRRNCKWI